MTDNPRLYSKNNPITQISFRELKGMLFDREACSGCKIEGTCTANNCMEWQRLTKNKKDTLR